MARYHLSPQDSQPRPCSARIKCEYADANDGKGVEHYPNKAAAMAAYASNLAKENKTFTTKRKGNTKQSKRASNVDSRGMLTPSAMKTFYANKDNWDRSKFNEPSTSSYQGYMPHAWRGSNYDPNKSLSDISSSIRKDIKKGTEAGYLPEGLKVSVRVRSGIAVDITVQNFGNVKNIFQWAPEKPVRGKALARGHKLNPEYQEVVDRLDEISKSYNYDDSYIQADDVNRGFYGQTTFEYGSSLATKTHKKNTEKINKIYKEHRDAGMSGQDIIKIPEVEEAYNNYIDSARYLKKQRLIENNVFHIANFTPEKEIDWKLIEWGADADAQSEAKELDRRMRNLLFT